MVAENTRNRHSGGPKALNQRSRQRVSWPYMAVMDWDSVRDWNRRWDDQ